MVSLIETRLACAEMKDFKRKIRFGDGVFGEKSETGNENQIDFNLVVALDAVRSFKGINNSHFIKNK